MDTEGGGQCFEHTLRFAAMASLPNMIAANSPRWDENRNRGKDESNRKPR